MLFIIFYVLFTSIISFSYLYNSEVDSDFEEDSIIFLVIFSILTGWITTPYIIGRLMADKDN